MSQAWKLARTMAQHGVKVIPVPPREKGCKLLNWPELASTDSGQIDAWFEAEPEGNYGAVCTPDTIVVLDADLPGLRSQIERTTSEEWPNTLSVKSSKGYHYYFRQTDKTRTIGNCKVPGMFDLQSDRKYVVSPGSVHPSGVTYTILNNTDIEPMPDWLAEHLNNWALRVTNAKSAGSVGTRGESEGRPVLHEDFDPEDFFEWYAEQDAFFVESNRSWNGKDVHVTDKCIIAGYKHTGSWHTGFITGDNVFGYHCESPECADPSIGDVLRKLNELGFERYPEPIWEEANLDGVDILDDTVVEDVTMISEDAYDQNSSSVPSTLERLRTPNSTTATEREQSNVLLAATQEQDESGGEEEASGAGETKASVDPDVRWAGYLENDSFNTGMLVKNAATFQMEELTWLWPQKIPKGKVSFFTGKPDCGKSLTLVDLIARVTTGADWPDGSKNDNPPGRVLLAASEDDPADTLIPRLAAAGADLTKVDIILGTMMELKNKNRHGKKRRTNLDLKRDAKLLLKTLIDNPDISLLALDPITSFFGDADTNKDKDVRPIMDAISKVCGKSGMTIVGLIHSNKRSDVDAVHKVSGAGALAAVVRAVWGFSRDAEDKKLCHMAFVKGNLGKDTSGIDYSIEEVFVGIKGRSVGVPRIAWGERNEVDADDLLRADRSKKDSKDMKLSAAEVLLKSLKLPMKAKDIYMAAEAQGMSATTMKRAKEKIDIMVKKQWDGWWWYRGSDRFPRSSEEKCVTDEMVEQVI